MLTLDEIRNIQFTKGIGGYKTAEVDDFVDQCIETVEALLDEKAETAKKMNVLADKLLEYRQEEDNIRTALLSAQKMGDAVVKEAKLKAEQIVSEANAKAAQIERIARAEIADEQATLDALKAQVADFKATLLSTYREHLELISSLPGEKAAPVEEEAKPAEEPTPEQEPIDLHNEPIEPVEMEDLSSHAAEEEAEELLEAPDLSLLAPQDPVLITEAPAKSRFSDLRFGDEYHIEDDDDGEEEEDDRKSRRRSKRKK